MAKILNGPEGILDAASWLGGGAYLIMYALKKTSMRDPVARIENIDDRDEFEGRLLRIATEAAEELECSPEDVDFVVSYMG